MRTEFLYAIAWPGAGRSLASPWLAYGIAAAVTVPFTVWLLYATRRKPSTDRPPNQFGPPPRSPWVVLLTAALALVPSLVRAAPSTTYWAPSTANCQAWKTPHVTYDTYFGKGPAAGSQGAPNYPIDTGLMMGILPSSKLQAEVGFDVLLPSEDPFFVNGKLCTPESSLFKGSPALSAGLYNVGALLTGPVWFFDKALQPGGRGFMWTFQLDIDVPLGRK